MWEILSMTSKPINASCQNASVDALNIADTVVPIATPAQNAGALAAENQQNKNPDLYFVWPDPESGKNSYGQH